MKAREPRFALLLAALLLPFSAFGLTTFSHRWNWHDAMVGRGVVMVPGGGYVVAGGTRSPGPLHGAILIRTDSLGDTVWTRHVQGLDPDGGYLARLADGGYAVAATSDGGRAWVQKFGPGGDSAWTVLSVTEGRVNDVIPTGDGGCLVVGMLPDTISDFGAIRLDGDGQELWSRYYEELRVFESWARGAAPAGNGGHILAGDCTDYMDSYVRLVRTDSSGAMLWTQLYSGPVGPSLAAVRQTGDGGFLAVGSEFDTLNYRDVFYVMRTDSAGEITGTARYAPPGTATVAHAMAATGDGGYVLAGQVGWADSARVWLVRTDGAGDTLWTRVLPGAGREVAYDVRQAEDGGYVVVGASDQGGGSLLFIKTDSLGDAHTGAAEGTGTPVPGVGLSVGPCPVRAAGRLDYVLDRAGYVELEIHDAAGRRTATLDRGFRSAGRHAVVWDSARLAAGTYFCVLRHGDGVVARPLVVLR